MSQTYAEVNRDLREEWLSLEGRSDSYAVSRRRYIGQQVFEVNENLLWANVRPFMKSASVSEEDLYTAAAEFLWKVFLNWDPSRSALSVAAHAHLSGGVRREVAITEFPGLSYDQFTKRGTVRKAQRTLKDKFGKEPTVEEISTHTGLSEEVISTVTTPQALSLDAPVSEEDGASLEDIVTTSDESSASSSEWSEEQVDSDKFVIGRASAEDLYVWYAKGSRSDCPLLTTVATELLTGVPRKEQDYCVRSARLETARSRVSELIDREPTATELSAVTGISSDLTEEFLTRDLLV